MPASVAEFSRRRPRRTSPLGVGSDLQRKRQPDDSRLCPVWWTYRDRTANIRLGSRTLDTDLGSPERRIPRSVRVPSGRAGDKCAVKPRVVADDPGVQSLTQRGRSRRRVCLERRALRGRGLLVPRLIPVGLVGSRRSRLEAAALSSGCRGPDLPARARVHPPSPAAACRRRNASRRGPTGSQTSVSPRRRTRRRATRRGPVPVGSCAG